MSQGEATSLWASVLADELARCGVEEVVLAPGSRSTPLVLAFASDGRFRLRVHLDERSAGFFALGVGKASRRPVAVLTTSGTAAANVLPVVVEAATSEAPLLVLTADRPARLQGADANQTIDQHGLYGSYPRAFHQLARPTAGQVELRHLRAVACRAVASALGPPGGPVHLNCPFDKPLERVGEPRREAEGRPDGRPFVRVSAATPPPDPDEIERLAELVQGTERGIVVAGPSSDPKRTGPAAVRLAAHAGFPLLADPLSGGRFGPSHGALVVAAYDLFLRDASVGDALVPELVVRVGQSPTSAALQSFLARHAAARHVVIDGGTRWLDNEGLATDYVCSDDAATLDGLAASLETRPRVLRWLESWERAGAAAGAAAGRRAPAGAHEGHVLASVTEALPDGGLLFVSSSMPVRDLDGYGAPGERRILALGNRGASGIDGIVSTACGASTAQAGPTVCVLGDVALFHDQNGLLWTREADVSVVFVLLDNDGGGIFHMLPVREHEPYFTPYFATPHGLDFRHTAGLFGLELEDVDPEGVRSALEAALGRGGSRILRVRTDREANRAGHEESSAAVRAAVREALVLGGREPE